MTQSDSSTDQAERWSSWQNSCALAIVLTTYGSLLWPMLTAPAGYLPSTMFHDYFSLFYPAAAIFRGLVRDGELPIWNPYTFCGVPLLASIQMGLLYPLNWLHVLISPTRAFNLLIVGHLCFAGWGTWLYCRGQTRSILASLSGAVVYGLAGRVILHQFAGHPHIVYSAAWLPFVFWMVDKCVLLPTIRHCLGLAVALAMSFLAGFPMLSLLLAYLIPIYLLVFLGATRDGYRWQIFQAAGVFALIAGLAAGMAAAQLLPTFEYMQQTHRGHGLNYAWATTSSFPLINLITFVIPGFFGDGVHISYWGKTSLWESTAHCGISAALLMLIGLVTRPDRRTLFWAGAAVCVMLVAAGKYSLVYQFCYSYLPGVDLFRGVAKLSIFVTLAIAILASRGVDAAITEVNSLSRTAKVISWFALSAGILGTIACMIEGSINAPVPNWWISFVDWVRSSDTFTLLSIREHEKAAQQSAAYDWMLRQVLIACVVLSITALVVLCRARLKRTSGLLLVGLICITSYRFASPYVVVSDTSPFREPAKQVRAAIHDDSPWRFACVGLDSSLVNQFAYEQLETPGGVGDSLLTRYVSLFQSLTRADAQYITYLAMPVVHESLFDLLNIKYYAAPTEAHRIGDSSEDRLLQSRVFVWKGVPFNLYENVDVLPRALIVHRIREIDYEEAGRILLPALLEEGAESASFVEGRLPFPVNEIGAGDVERERCDIVEHRTTQMRIEARLEQPGVILVLENAYPGWKAEVDGEPAEVFPANLVMRAIPVPAGAHTIELRYEPTSFRTGMMLSCLSIIMVVLGLLWSFRSRPDDPLTFLSPARSGSWRFTRSSVIRSLGLWLTKGGYFGGLIALLLLVGAWLSRSLADVTVPGQERVWSDSIEFWVLVAATFVAGNGWWLARRHWRLLFFGTVTVLLIMPLTLAIAEGFARFFVPAWPTIGLHGVEPEVANRTWAKGGSSAAGAGVNDWGQRDRQRRVVPSKGVTRLAYIGDSFLEERTATPLSMRVEDGLTQDSIEVINLGVSASSPDEYYFRLRNIALPLGIDHCVMFIFAGNDFVEAEQSLESYLGLAAVYPRNSLFSSIGLLGVNHLMTNHRRPVLQAWLGSTDLRKQEELRSLAISTSRDDQIRQLLLTTANLPPDQMERLQTRLGEPRMSGFYEMLRHPDSNQFRSYYLSRGLWSASIGGGQWEENNEETALFWVTQAARLCEQEDARFTLVIVPEAFAVDSRMVEQWDPLTDMRHLTSPCAEAAERLSTRALGAGIEVIDLHEDFQDVPGTYLNLDGHWSDKGIELAADVLLRELFP